MSAASSLPRVRVDFQNVDRAGRVRLNTAGALEDIQAQGLALEPRLALRLVDAELEANGRAVFSRDESIWGRGGGLGRRDSMIDLPRSLRVAS